jgi:hypothetical protein
VNSTLNHAWLRGLGLGLTALAAALCAIWFFNILTPARDINLILNSKEPPTTPTEAPTPTPLPTPPALVLSDDFSGTANFTPSAQAHYEPNGFVLDPQPNTDFLTAPLFDFVDTTYHNLSLIAEAAPAVRSGPVEYGVFFWHSVDANKHERFIAFTVTSAGMYRLRAFVPSTTSAGRFEYRSVDLVPPTRSLYVNANRTTNRLRVDVHPHQVFAFVNDELLINRDNADVDAYRDRPDFDGRVGLIAIATGETNAQVNFTKFELYADVTK